MRRCLTQILMPVIASLLLPYAGAISEAWAIASEQPGAADVFGEVDANCTTGWCGYFSDPNKTLSSSMPPSLERIEGWGRSLSGCCRIVSLPLLLQGRRSSE